MEMPASEWDETRKNENEQTAVHGRVVDLTFVAYAALQLAILHAGDV